MDVTSSFSICTHSPFPTFLYLEKESVLDISHPIHRSIGSIYGGFFSQLFACPLPVNSYPRPWRERQNSRCRQRRGRRLRHRRTPVHPPAKPKKVVGLDCDCLPNERGQHPNKVATLQLCTEDFIVILLQLLYLEFMPTASDPSLTTHPQVTFVGSKMREHVKVSWDCGAQRDRHWSVEY